MLRLKVCCAATIFTTPTIPSSAFPGHLHGILKNPIARAHTLSSGDAGADEVQPERVSSDGTNASRPSTMYTYR
ncbi:hypothetical protein PF005_g25702 [Phytophthora fragariae]|uniref:Uncharacterized protein n=2 Tax=Phytophthora TaxID=4783 RepID=A0A6A3DPJ3_9STRA|nr:hypothetical protein PF003_g26257 [Phytophthora fragariae]KAE8990205.1 hypothetical protein PR001_g21564 [Phytophthora rubi]KAE8923369.1 hypothetical protein PF009_g26383 [Phytophthora fragariae]KAE8972667.1 hypothetical protein PF011_g25556 [Phytophthora fragariae]KAE8990825.1 hypothetical protein PR002_g21047 [Phytophthora rubi]